MREGTRNRRECRSREREFHVKEASKRKAEDYEESDLISSRVGCVLQRNGEKPKDAAY